MPVGEALALAERHRSAGRLDEAAALCRKILAAAPNEPNAEHVLGLVAHQAGRLGEAIEHIRRAVALAPDMPLYHANLGEMCRLAGRIEDAVIEGRRAVDLKPDYPEALSNLGVALYEQKKYEEASAYHRRAVALRPDFALGHNNLGNALYGLKRFEEAIAAYRRAIALEAAYADAWSNLGTALHHSGHYEEAIVALRRALALAPSHANAHSGLGILLLMRGDFAEGLDEEARADRLGRLQAPLPQQPWQGESLAGLHICVQAEQGFGDTIQFVRYLPLLKDRAGSVIVCVHKPLVALMRENFPGIEVVAVPPTPLRADCDCALLSLPRLFKTRLETIPAPVPYLRPSADVAARWQQRLATMLGLKIGLVWAGRPEHANNHRRSLALTALAPLFQVPGVSFASLQVGDPAAELAANSALKIADFSPQLTDFNETAGALAALDLLIAVDTSAAHLAGALGRPVWVLLPSVTDWRWLLGREDNRWYPTMRLFRQQADEPWAAVIARAAVELAAAADGDTQRLMPFREQGERQARIAAEIIAIQNSLEASPPPAPAQTLPPQQALMHAERLRRAGRLGDAEDLCRKAIASQPNSEAEHLLGLIAHQSGKLAEAIEHVRRAIALDGKVALYHANLGEMCRLSGRPDLAADAARRAIEIEPDYPGALSNLGIALYELKDHRQALDCYDRAIALMPEFADAHSNRGNALRALDRLAEAEAAYRRALEVNPAFAQAWNNLGTVLRELKRPEEAVEAYHKALAQSPEDPHTLDNLALALMDLEQHEEATELLRRALAFDPHNPKVGVHLGSVLIDQRKAEAATPIIEQVLTRDPANSDAINLRGRVAFERGALVEALSYYRRSLEFNPNAADTHNNIGNALRDLGRLDEARDAFRKGLELDPKNIGIYVSSTSGSARLTPTSRITRPIYTSAVGRWRVYQASLGPLLAELGSGEAAGGGRPPG
jgi:tetratricopeptide (TPR) repeat protein